MTEQAAATLHLDVGDTFTFASQSWEQFDAFGSPDGPTGNEPPGPTVPLQIVGIGSSLLQKIQPDDAVGWVTEEFAARYDREISHIGGADGFDTVLSVWVDGGEAAIAAVQHAMDNVGSAVAFNRLSTFATPATASTGTMASGALVFALIAAVAGAGAIAVAVLRHVARLRHDRLELEVLGTTPRGAALLGAATVVPAAVAAGVVTVVATLAASRLMPFGATARRLDPDVGALPSTPTLLAACAAVAVTIVAMALIGSWRWKARRGQRPASIVPRMTSGLLGRWPAVATDVGFAVEGRGASQPGVVRAALIAGSAGTLGLHVDRHDRLGQHCLCRRDVLARLPESRCVCRRLGDQFGCAGQCERSKRSRRCTRRPRRLDRARHRSRSSADLAERGGAERLAGR